MSRLTALFIVLIFVVSCDQFREMAGTAPADLNSIKSITTTFISHQDDTQEKDERIIAVATFYPDGTIENLTQHMTYPYNYKEPREKQLWDEPIKSHLTHVMDGLELGHAEKSLLYGNDWPVKYANYINKKGHPTFQMRGEVLSNVSFDYLPGGLPSKIEVRNESIFIGNSEEFDYNGNQVTKYFIGTVINNDVDLDKIWPVTSIEEKDHMFKRFLQRPRDKQPQAEFKYSGDLLTEVQEVDRVYKFIYGEQEKLTRSEFYLRNKLMNYRDFHYTDSGINQKTEIFNVDNQLEYTIEYQYEFF